jgi:hypothetical protein
MNYQSSGMKTNPVVSNGHGVFCVHVFCCSTQSHLPLMRDFSIVSGSSVNWRPCYCHYPTMREFNMRKSCAVIMGGALLFWPMRGTLEAQVSPQDSIAALVIAHLDSTFNVMRAGHILMRVDGPTSLTLLNALADTLEALVMDQRPGTVADALTHRYAMDALCEAASAYEGTPLKGAEQRLFRLAQRAPDIGHRAMAISSLADARNTVLAVSLLKSLVPANDAVSILAIQTLAARLGSAGGFDFLHGVYQSQRITDRLAVRALRDVAVQQGWKEPHHDD